MTPEAPQARGAAACPDAEVLAAYVDGMATPAERSEIERHLVECAECRDVVGGAVTLAGSGAPAVTARRSRKWLAGGGALLAAATIIIAIGLGRQWTTDRARFEGLLPAAGLTRPIEPRLTIMADYGPAPSATRSGSPAVNPDPDARIAAARIEQQAEQDPSSENLHALGLARLLTQDAAQAIAPLERASENDRTGRVLADLSAALLVQSQRTGDSAMMARARTTAERAITLDSTRLEALFNAALAAELQGATADAIAGWQRYLAADQVSRWADEARERVTRLQAGKPRN